MPRGKVCLPLKRMNSYRKGFLGFFNVTLEPKTFLNIQVKPEYYVFVAPRGGEEEWIFSWFLIKPVSESHKGFIKLNQLIFHSSLLQYLYHIILKWNQFPSPPFDERNNMSYRYVTDWRHLGLSLVRKSNVKLLPRRAPVSTIGFPLWSTGAVPGWIKQPHHDQACRLTLESWCLPLWSGTLTTSGEPVSDSSDEQEECTD